MRGLWALVGGVDKKLSPRFSTCFTENLRSSLHDDFSLVGIFLEVDLAAFQLTFKKTSDHLYVNLICDEKVGTVDLEQARIDSLACFPPFSLVMYFCELFYNDLSTAAKPTTTTTTFLQLTLI